MPTGGASSKSTLAASGAILVLFLGIRLFTDAANDALRATLRLVTEHFGAEVLDAYDRQPRGRCDAPRLTFLADVFGPRLLPRILELLDGVADTFTIIAFNAFT